jgi:hypothetical protein
VRLREGGAVAAQRGAVPAREERLGCMIISFEKEDLRLDMLLSSLLTGTNCSDHYSIPSFVSGFAPGCPLNSSVRRS